METLQEVGVSKEVVENKLMEEFELSEAEVEIKVEKYWKG